MSEDYRPGNVLRRGWEVRFYDNSGAQTWVEVMTTGVDLTSGIVTVHFRDGTEESVHREQLVYCRPPRGGVVT